MVIGGLFQIRIVATVVLLAAAALTFRHFWLADSARPVRSGEPLRGLSVHKLDGSPISLGTRPGHWTLINVFASWCTPCRDEFPDLAKAAVTLRARGVDVVGIDQAEGAASVLSVSQQFGLQYPMFLDSDLVSQHRLGARVIPETISVDPMGIVRAIHSGPLDEAGFIALANSQSNAP
jgi:thiol-disulfide isomerase/thioredoxin